MNDINNYLSMKCKDISELMEIDKELEAYLE